MVCVRFVSVIYGIAALVSTVAPATAQEGEPSHEVQSGDTLWDLAAQYLANPFRWNEIFELNPTVVEDPHWIFPGERLRIPALVDEPYDSGIQIGGHRRPPRERPDVADRATAAQEVGPGERKTPGAFPEASVFRRPPGTESTEGALLLDEGVPLMAVSSSDFHRAAVLTNEADVRVGGVTDRIVEENPLGLRLPPGVRMHDQVVVHLDGLAVGVGDSLLAVRWGREIRGRGRVLASLALLEVTRTTADSARAVVVALFGHYRVGDPVVPVARYTPARLDQAVEVVGGTVGTVVDFVVPQTLVAPGEAVFLDVGADAGVQVGDEFAVFSPTESSPSSAPIEDRLCTVRVIRTTAAYATAMVVEVRDPGTRPGAPTRLIRRVAPRRGG